MSVWSTRDWEGPDKLQDKFKLEPGVVRCQQTHVKEPDTHVKKTGGRGFQYFEQEMRASTGSQWLCPGAASIGSTMWTALAAQWEAE